MCARRAGRAAGAGSVLVAARVTTRARAGVGGVPWTWARFRPGSRPRRLGLDPGLNRAQVQGTPPTPALARVVTRAATRTDPAPAARPARRAHMNHQQLRVLVEHDTLDHRSLDAQQTTP